MSNARAIYRRDPASDRFSPTTEVIGSNGAQGRDRTTDTAIFSRMLYQLSYLGSSHSRGRLGSGRFIVRPGSPVYPHRKRPKKHAKSSSIGVFVLMLAARNRLEMR